MQKNNFKNMIISFDRPKDSTTTGYNFLKNPPKIEGGGLYDQVVMVKEEVSLQNLIETFIEASETLSSTIGETASYVIASVFSLVWNSTSVKLFPDEYKGILDLIEDSEKGMSLKLDRLDELIEEDREVLAILEALIAQGFLRKKQNGEYVVRKKVIANIHVSFLQIAK